MSSLTRMSLAVLALALAALFLAPVAQAHAIPTTTWPTQGQLVVGALEEIGMTVTQAVEPSGTKLSLRDAEGTTVAGPGAEVTNATTVILHLKAPLAQGGYIVHWQTLSQVDGHHAEGRWSFVVGEGAPPIVEEQAARLEPLPVLQRLPIVLAILAVGGLLAWRLLLLAGPSQHVTSWVDARVRTWGLGAAAVVLAGSILSVARWSARAGLPAPTSSFALASLAVVFGGLATGSSALLIRRGKRRPAWALLAAGWGVLLVALSASSHTVAALGLASGTPLATVHWAATSAWSGGVLVLLGLLRSTGHRPVPTILLRRFGWMAGTSAIISVLTGLLMALAIRGPEVVTWPASPYDQTLAIKVGLVVVAGLLGVANHLRIRGRSAVKRTVRLELCMMAAIVLAAASLGQGSPHPPTYPMSPSDGVSSVRPLHLTGNSTSYLLELAVLPGPAVGVVANWSVQVVETDTGLGVGADARVTLHLTPPDGNATLAQRLGHLGPGKFGTTGALLITSGSWEVRVHVEHRGGTEQVAFEVPAVGT